MTPTEYRNQIEMIGEEFVKQVKAGLNPKIEEFVAKFPERETELRDFVKALYFVEKCKS